MNMWTTPILVGFAVAVIGLILIAMGIIEKG